MIIFLYGTDTFRSRAQLKKMTDKFRADRDPQGLNIVRLNALTEDCGRILQEMLSAPFLAERRMVVVYHLLASGEDELQEEILARIEAGTLSSSNVVIFWEDTDKFTQEKASALFKRLAQEKFAQKFEALKGAHLSLWITEEAAARGLSIHPQAVRFLVEHVGSDSWAVHHIIEQAHAYVSGGEITADVLRKFADEKADDNIFNLVDALVAGSIKQVYAMMRAQYAKGEDAGYIFAMIVRQFRILLQLRDVFEREDEMKSDELARRLGLHPYVVKKSLPAVRRFGMPELERGYGLLLDIDRKTKTGGGTQAMLLDLFVARMGVR